MSRLQKISIQISKLRNIFNKIPVDKTNYRYRLVDVKSRSNSDISLSILVTGIKRQIIEFSPDEIVGDDVLLSEFSPCDVRAITYLSFQKYFVSEISPLKIESQTIRQGITIFNLVDLSVNYEISIDARSLYQNYELLTRLSKKDMIGVISTAVQQQTISDIKKMEEI